MGKAIVRVTCFRSVCDRQRGVALLYVLLIFSMIALMASQLVVNLLSYTEKNARFIERVQAKHYAFGAEQYVALLLEADFQEDKKKNRQVDHKQERWNVSGVDYEVDEGYIDLVVIDEQGEFNINWLRSTDKEGSKYLQMFENLLSAINMDIGLAKQVQEWLGADPDSADDNAAAADNAYLLLDSPRRIANTGVVSVSELKLVDGMSVDDFELLAPFVSMLPKVSKMNLNTALPEVIQSISEKISESDAEAIIAGRGKEGFAKMSDISKVTEVQHALADLRSAPLSFFSQYFSTYIKATYRDTSFYMKTLFFRNDEGQVQVVGREIGPNSYWLINNKDT